VKPERDRELTCDELSGGGFFRSVARLLDRRPWLPAAVYLALCGLVALIVFVAVANLVPGKFRLWAELDKADLVIVARISTAIGRVMVIYALLLVVIPLLFLLKRDIRRLVLRVWGYGIGAIALSIVVAFLFAPLVFVGGLELDAAVREGGEEERVRDWTNSTECGPKNDYQFPRTRYRFIEHNEDKGVYDLFDRRVHRVVVKDVMRWQEQNDRLRFVTKDGTRYFIAYWEGRIRHYPDLEGVHGKSAKDDEIYERLKVE